MPNDPAPNSKIFTPDKIARDFPRLLPCLNGLVCRETAETLNVSFIHEYFAAWFEKHWSKDFEAAAASIKPGVKIIYESPFITTNLSPVSGAPKKRREENFSNFICADKNAETVTALKMAVDDHNGFFILIYGPSGVGKTHLLRSVETALSEKGLNASLDKATFFRAGKNPSRTAVEIFWRSSDALLLDDLQDLENDEEGQEILSRYLDAAESGRPTRNPRLIFTCLGSSSRQNRFGERLRSRLALALVLELTPPDIDSRLRYAEMAGAKLPFPPSRRHCLHAAKNATIIPEIKGLFQKWRLFATIRGRQPALDELDGLARTSVKSGEKETGEILSLVANKFGLSTEELLSPSRKSEIALARQIAAYLCRFRLGLSFPELGKILGGKDHSTVMHAVKKIKFLLETDKKTRKLITELEQELA